MNPEEALNLLVQVTGTIHTDRKSHGQIQIALASLQKVIEDNKTLRGQRSEDKGEKKENEEG